MEKWLIVRLFRFKTMCVQAFGKRDVHTDVKVLKRMIAMDGLAQYLAAQWIKQAFIVLMLMGFPFQAIAQIIQPSHPVWSYKGNTAPERWGELDPRFSLCASGKQQSPIDIPKQVLPLKLPLIPSYNPAPFSVLRTPHTIKFSFTPEIKEQLNFNGEVFKLIAIEVHAPSEHLWHGRDFPLEIHLIHQNALGKLLYMAIFAKGGAENQELMKMLGSGIPNEVNTVQQVSWLRLNPENLLPINRTYYAFMGSLTVPPCKEGIQWIVFANPINVSPAQIVRFKQLFDGVNARPVQPLNKRKIFYSTQRKEAGQLFS